LDTDVEQNIFGPEFLENLKSVKLPATKLEVLSKLIRQSINEYKKTNKIAAEKFEEMLNKTLEEYFNRRKSLSDEEGNQIQRDAIDAIIKNATDKALEILKSLGEDKDSFRKLDMTFEEKAFYDILIHLRDEYNFEFGTDKKVNGIIINEECKALAQKIKKLIDEQSSKADWLNNAAIRTDLNKKLFFCLKMSGYPPVPREKVFENVLGQVENFKKNLD
jgi:type I restriction enzyme R subunit